MITETYEECVANFLTTLPQYLGYGGLLVQKDKDGGDSALRFSTMFTLLGLIGDHELIDKAARIHPSMFRAFQQIEVSKGIYRRYPDPTFWGFDPRNMSRDQLSIVKLAMLMTDNPKIKDIAVRQLLRLGFHQNYFDDGHYKIPDPMVPSELATYLRAFLGPWSRLFNEGLDAFMLLDLVFRNVGELNIWSTDQLLAQNLLVAKHKYETWSAKVIMFFYKKTNMLTRLWNYHANPKNNGCEPLYWLYMAAFKKLEGL